MRYGPDGAMYLSGGRFNIDGDVSPLALQKSGNAERTAGDVAGEDREPYVDRFERNDLFDHKADPKRYNDLRDDRNIKRPFSIAAPLQASRINECNGDEHPRNAQYTQQLSAYLKRIGIGHPKNTKQLLRQKKEN